VKFLSELYHLCWLLDPRYSQEVPSSADALHSLRSEGAPDLCYVMSNVAELDGREMPLQEAIEAADAAEMMGTVVDCIPGRLAYYSGEGAEGQMILRRPANQPMHADGASPAADRHAR